MATSSKLWGEKVLPDFIPQEAHDPIAKAAVATQLLGGIGLLPVGGARTRYAALPLLGFYGFAAYTEFATRGKDIKTELFSTSKSNTW
eukprot:CAMPEP_0117649368 /NCGR_PEP_ID=MMETSP0804-20121206/932_1 /TAXON_ID=1074897 /ORGANISM="Tetraselmis astigmatica, Strain CCMP880" /LENGTH=87 /DNA_ID=CAMNT_0005455095 /DNA_START=329 /DNA_END=589 /DNA_ORIENTATION=+